MSPISTFRRVREREAQARLGPKPGQGDPAALGGVLDPAAFVLEGRRVDARFGEVVTGGSVKTTIEGASTLTLNVHDTDRWLLRSRLLNGGQVRMDAGSLEWALSAVSYRTADSEAELVFEDRRVAEMRRRDKPRKVAREKSTRAEFVKMLVDELPKDVRPIFVCPELKVKQPIGRAQDKKPRRERDDDRERGLPSNASLRGKGPLSPYQVNNAERVLDVAESLNAPEAATLALLMACIVEAPDFSNPAGGDDSSVGILQLLDIHLGGSTSTNGGRRDVELVVKIFLTKGFTGQGGAISIASKNPSMSPGEIAQAVQGSAFPGRYAEYGDQAREIYDAYGGMSGDRTRTVTETKRYEFSRGRPGGPSGEDTWDCSLRLAEEVGWRRFMVRNRFYFMAEDDLIKSRPRAKISEASPGVEDMEFEIDGRRNVNELTLTCRSSLWKAPPGSVILVDKMGDLLDGRWLVSEIERDLFTTESTIELRRKGALLKDKPEPAPETVTRTIRSGGGISLPGLGGLGGGRAAKAEAVYQAAKRISGQKRGYTYGGGHGVSLSSLTGGGNLDCSSAVSLALWMAGAFDQTVAWTSGLFASNYGEPGPGEFCTIWGDIGHVFMEGNLPGIGYWRFDTANNGTSGPRLVTYKSSTAGMSARHPS